MSISVGRRGFRSFPRIIPFALALVDIALDLGHGHLPRLVLLGFFGFGFAFSFTRLDGGNDDRLSALSSLQRRPAIFARPLGSRGVDCCRGTARQIGGRCIGSVLAFGGFRAVQT